MEDFNHEVEQTCYKTRYTRRHTSMLPDQVTWCPCLGVRDGLPLKIQISRLIVRSDETSKRALPYHRFFQPKNSFC